MHKTKFGRMALATFFVAGWVAFFSGAIEYAQAQFESRTSTATADL